MSTRKTNIFKVLKTRNDRKRKRDHGAWTAGSTTTTTSAADKFSAPVVDHPPANETSPDSEEIPSETIMDYTDSIAESSNPVVSSADLATDVARAKPLRRRRKQQIQYYKSLYRQNHQQDLEGNPPPIHRQQQTRILQHPDMSSWPPTTATSDPFVASLPFLLLLIPLHVAWDQTGRQWPSYTKLCQHVHQLQQQNGALQQQLLQLQSNLLLQHERTSGDTALLPSARESSPVVLPTPVPCRTESSQQFCPRPLSLPSPAATQTNQNELHRHPTRIGRVTESPAVLRQHVLPGQQPLQRDTAKRETSASSTTTTGTSSSTLILQQPDSPTICDSQSTSFLSQEIPQPDGHKDHELGPVYQQQNHGDSPNTSTNNTNATPVRHGGRAQLDHNAPSSMDKKETPATALASTPLDQRPAVTKAPTTSARPFALTRPSKPWMSNQQARTFVQPATSMASPLGQLIPVKSNQPGSPLLAKKQQGHRSNGPSVSAAPPPWSDKKKEPSSIQPLKRSNSDFWDSPSQSQYPSQNPDSSSNHVQPNNNHGSDENAAPYCQVVRNRAERQALKPHDCPECGRFIDVLMAQDPNGQHYNRHELMCASRHRHQFTPPATPQTFWELSLWMNEMPGERQTTSSRTAQFA
eukprot:Nitzschia sp. Nitz4//scaffold127_size64804//369//2279//NITZ4_006171-RA/size64804-processed-gene-0.25-mRNA-1//-1//CDS//3329534735//4233//frame0